MRDPRRIRKILGEINHIWKRYPDMRFGQLVDNLYTKFHMDKEIPPTKDFFYTEDDEFLDWLIRDFGGF